MYTYIEHSSTSVDCAHVQCHVYMCQWCKVHLISYVLYVVLALHTCMHMYMYYICHNIVEKLVTLNCKFLNMYAYGDEHIVHTCMYNCMI